MQGELHFSGELLAEIFLGQIKNWNSPAIAKLNPKVSLPDLPIKVVHRPAGKGSNYVFTEFLSKSSTRFKSEIGTSPSPKRPVGDSAERSADMADKVKGQSGAIGYVEAQYAIKAQILYGSVLNEAGHYIKGNDKSITAACKAVESPGWDRFSASLVNAPGADSYPITSFTWFYLRTKGGDPGRVSAMHDLLGWMYTEGQAIADREGYSELPPLLLEAVKGKEHPRDRARDSRHVAGLLRVTLRPPSGTFVGWTRRPSRGSLFMRRDHSNLSPSRGPAWGGIMKLMHLCYAALGIAVARWIFKRQPVPVTDPVSRFRTSGLL